MIIQLMMVQIDYVQQKVNKVTVWFDGPAFL